MRRFNRARVYHENTKREVSVGLNLSLHSIDEGITGYRDDSLEVSGR